ncbi:MAG: class I SAM-dependent methyltransferase [Candidatus Nanohaloarchaea archaeon]
MAHDDRDWYDGLQDGRFPGWRNVNGTAPGRLYAMGLDGVLERYMDVNEIWTEIGCATGYTTVGAANITGAEMVGVDLPHVVDDTVTDPYGDGPEPAYVGAVAPDLPFAEGAFDGVLAPNSLTYLARQIGQEDGAAARQAFVDETLTKLGRITRDNGALILAEQADSSRLVLERETDADPPWTVAEYDAEPEAAGGPAFHLRYEPWVSSEEVRWSTKSERSDHNTSKQPL